MFKRLLSFAFPAMLAVFPSARAADVSGSVALTSDYVFRGISQSNETAAGQAGVRVDTAPGIYGSVWASRVDFDASPDAWAEIDYVLGFRRTLGADWVGDLNLTAFTYAGASELNYVEGIATATWRDRRWVALGISGDVFATGHAGVYAQGGLRTPLADNLRLELIGGYYWLDRAYARNYAHGQATVAWLVKPGIELRLGGHLADHDARAVFGDLAGPRLEASLQASL